MLKSTVEDAPKASNSNYWKRSTLIGVVVTGVFDLILYSKPFSAYTFSKRYEEFSEHFSAHAPGIEARNNGAARGIDGWYEWREALDNIGSYCMLPFRYLSELVRMDGFLKNSYALNRNLASIAALVFLFLPLIAVFVGGAIVGGVLATVRDVIRDTFNLLRVIFSPITPGAITPIGDSRLFRRMFIIIPTAISVYAAATYGTSFIGAVAAKMVLGNLAIALMTSMQTFFSVFGVSVGAISLSMPPVALAIIGAVFATMVLVKVGKMIGGLFDDYCCDFHSPSFGRDLSVVPPESSQELQGRESEQQGKQSDVANAKKLVQSLADSNQQDASPPGVGLGSPMSSKGQPDVGGGRLLPLNLSEPPTSDDFSGFADGAVVFPPLSKEQQIHYRRGANESSSEPSSPFASAADESADRRHSVSPAFFRDTRGGAKAEQPRQQDVPGRDSDAQVQAADASAPPSPTQ